MIEKWRLILILILTPRNQSLKNRVKWTTNNFEVVQHFWATAKSISEFDILSYSREVKNSSPVRNKQNVPGPKRERIVFEPSFLRGKISLLNFQGVLNFVNFFINTALRLYLLCPANPYHSPYLMANYLLMLAIERRSVSKLFVVMKLCRLFKTCWKHDVKAAPKPCENHRGQKQRRHW